MRAVFFRMGVHCFMIFLFLTSSSRAEQNNFQIMPPPIAYPYFEAGRMDGKIEPIVVNIQDKQGTMNLTGGGVNFDGRAALNQYLAGDVQVGLFGLGGEMPGIPPITPIPAYSGGTFLGYYTTSVTHKATVSMMAFQMSLNVELQPLKGDLGNIIIFAGPNVTLQSMTIETPYRLIFAPTSYVSSVYTDRLTFTSSMGGFQFGAQLGIKLGNEVMLSPFFMASSSSGSSTIQDDPGVPGVHGISRTSDQESSSTSYGMDIIIGKLSIGTILQDLKSKQEQTKDQNTRITMFRVGYHF